MSLQQRRERERAQRHQLIVTAAREMAEAEGWGAVTTRRLAERIEYSQPVLYSHFAGKNAIVAAVALEGFTELAAAMREGRAAAADPEQALAAATRAYTEFADGNPALYDAMFVLATDLPFGSPDTPAPLQAAFDELSSALAPLTGGRDLETFTEVVWGAVHGLVTLAREGRLRPGLQEQRLTMLLDQLCAAYPR
ncbi:MAG: TetR/AcrR family transcriptional regulator [Nocardiopsaceae bacterium]|nr:TetR/AcrR family transcriptional regulator [Nocardiopsaceae bacterium]